ncbi:hypothetical protein BDZ90DRAFT_261694 [Jaminaea rosea]|uniref:Uncharacterized protein n=1 Tax=Jaminaea rosea TaxID=1569628 RepID=A0A316UKZ9_9BASI|nr:hypothetical protein BDZ90DRAFT_261694 [Jaminaea rosea]PWN25910.1 hypothetical protein BDZ90DRAFT_261694 [Jaminaea rosea]
MRIHALTIIFAILAFVAGSDALPSSLPAPNIFGSRGMSRRLVSSLPASLINTYTSNKGNSPATSSPPTGATESTQLTGGSSGSGGGDGDVNSSTSSDISTNATSSPSATGLDPAFVTGVCLNCTVFSQIVQGEPAGGNVTTVVKGTSLAFSQSGSAYQATGSVDLLGARYIPNQEGGFGRGGYDCLNGAVSSYIHCPSCQQT